MKRKISLLFLALISLVFHKAGANASNVDNFGIGSEAGALGGAVSASVDSPFAVFYNPAGLANEDGKTFSAGAIVLNLTLNGKNYRSGNNISKDFEDQSNDCISPHIGYSAKVTNRLALGIAVYVPYGFSIKWDKNTGNNPAAFNCYESWYIREAITPGFSYKITNNFFLGASVSIGKSTTGKYFTSQRLSQMLGQSIAFETELDDDLNFSYNIGLMYKPIDRLSFGLAYRGRSEAAFEGECKIRSKEQIPFPKTAFDVELESVDHPEQVQAGFKYLFTDKLSIEADLLWINWSIVKDEIIVFKKPTQQMINILHGNKEIFKRGWKDTTQVKLGVEYLLNDIVTLRCGYYNDPSPIPDNSFDLEWPDCDKKTYSIGAGFNFNKWTIDSVLLYSITDTREIDFGESLNLNDSYISGDVYTKASGSVLGLGLTFSYNF